MKTLVTLGLMTWGIVAAPAQTANLASPPAAYRSDRILVMPRSDQAPALDQLLRSHNSRVLESFPGLGGLRVVSVPATENVPGWIERVEQSGLVQYAEPDYLRTLDVIPNDPQVTNGIAWALNNLGQNGGVADADIDAPEAWDVLTLANDIVVAMIDSGILRTHEDLAANVWTDASGTGYGWNALLDNEAPADGDGHGTMMAGVIGGVGNNGKGSAGVAWQVRLMACKSFNTPASGADADIIEGIEFARSHGAHVINMSLSGAGFSQSLSNAIYAAREAGIIVVASAGNSPVDLDVQPRYPACFEIDNLVSVAATTRADALWSSSGYGATTVDLAAPGHQITSTFFANTNSYLGPLSGTSYSAAFVSGACALLRARYPGETHQQIIARLLAGVDPLPALVGKCATGGRLNLRQALSPPIQLTLLSPPGVLPLQLRVSAGPTRSCVVEASTNLIQWLPVHTNTSSAAGTFDYTATESTNAPQYYFRAVSTW